MTKYGTVIDNTIHPAPRAIRIGGVVVCNPTPAQYEASGYKRVVDTPPQTDSSHYAAANKSAIEALEGYPNFSNGSSVYPTTILFDL